MEKLIIALRMINFKEKEKRITAFESFKENFRSALGALYQISIACNSSSS